MPRSSRKKQLQRERAKARLFKTDTGVLENSDGETKAPVFWAPKLKANGHIFYRAGRESYIWRPVDGRDDSLVLGPEDMQPGTEGSLKLYYVAKLGGLHVQDYFSVCRNVDADVDVELDFSRWGFIEGTIMLRQKHWLDTYPMQMQGMAAEITGNALISNNAREDAINEIRTQIFGAEYAPFD